MISLFLLKMGKNNDFHLSFSQIVGAWQDFMVVTKPKTKLRVHYFGFLGMPFVWIFKRVSVHNLGSVQLICKSIKLGQNSSHCDFFGVSVSLSIQDFKLVPVPCTTPKWPIDSISVQWDATGKKWKHLSNSISLLFLQCMLQMCQFRM